MASLLFNISNDIFISVLTDWVTDAKEVASFDVALSNYGLRKKYFECMRKVRLQYQIDCNDPKSKKFFWFKRRKVMIENAELASDILPKPYHYYIFNANQLLHVKVDFRGGDYQISIGKILKVYPNLLSLSASKFNGKLLDTNVPIPTKRKLKLQHLEFHEVTVNHADWVNFFAFLKSSAPNFKECVLKDNAELTIDIVAFLVNHFPQLESLTFHHWDVSNTEDLIVLTISPRVVGEFAEMAGTGTTSSNLKRFACEFLNIYTKSIPAYFYYFLQHVLLRLNVVEEISLDALCLQGVQVMRGTAVNTTAAAAATAACDIDAIHQFAHMITKCWKKMRRIAIYDCALLHSQVVEAIQQTCLQLISLNIDSDRMFRDFVDLSVFCNHLSALNVLHLPVLVNSFDRMDVSSFTKSHFQHLRTLHIYWQTKSTDKILFEILFANTTLQNLSITFSKYYSGNHANLPALYGDLLKMICHHQKTSLITLNLEFTKFTWSAEQLQLLREETVWSYALLQSLRLENLPMDTQAISSILQVNTLLHDLYVLHQDLHDIDLAPLPFEKLRQLHSLEIRAENVRNISKEKMESIIVNCPYLHTLILVDRNSSISKYEFKFMPDLRRKFNFRVKVLKGLYYSVNY